MCKWLWALLFILLSFTSVLATVQAKEKRNINNIIKSNFEESSSSFFNSTTADIQNYVEEEFENARSDLEKKMYWPDIITYVKGYLFSWWSELLFFVQNKLFKSVP